MSDYYADQLANDFEAELAGAARIPDQALGDLATQQILASYNGSEPGPLLEALGQRHASGIVWGKGEGTVSLSFKVSWGSRTDASTCFFGLGNLPARHHGVDQLSGTSSLDTRVDKPAPMCLIEFHQVASATP